MEDTKLELPEEKEQRIGWPTSSRVAWWWINAAAEGASEKPLFADEFAEEFE